ncbi:hypothetical protein BD410DRAFT_829572, partial [Rickenella mellea]
MMVHVHCRAGDALTVHSGSNTPARAGFPKAKLPRSKAQTRGLIRLVTSSGYYDLGTSFEFGITPQNSSGEMDTISWEPYIITRPDFQVAIAGSSDVGLLTTTNGLFGRTEQSGETTGEGWRFTRFISLRELSLLERSFRYAPQRANPLRQVSLSLETIIRIRRINWRAYGAGLLLLEFTGITKVSVTSDAVEFRFEPFVE